MKQIPRVRALRDIIISDDDVTLMMVPKGMTGNLVGCKGNRPEFPQDTASDGVPTFVVLWDFHAVGDCANCTSTDYTVVEGDFDSYVPTDSVEFTGPAASSELDEPDGEDDGLEARRVTAADQALAEYDFGDQVVKDTSGWDDLGDDWSCDVYMENGDEPSIKEKFVVRFVPDTDTVQEAYVAG